MKKVVLLLFALLVLAFVGFIALSNAGNGAAPTPAPVETPAATQAPETPAPVEAEAGKEAGGEPVTVTPGPVESATEEEVQQILREELVDDATEAETEIVLSEGEAVGGF